MNDEYLTKLGASVQKAFNGFSITLNEAYTNIQKFTEHFNEVVRNYYDALEKQFEMGCLYCGGEGYMVVSNWTNGKDEVICERHSWDASGRFQRIGRLRSGIESHPDSRRRLQDMCGKVRGTHRQEADAPRAEADGNSPQPLEGRRLSLGESAVAVP